MQTESWFVEDDEHVDHELYATLPPAELRRPEPEYRPSSPWPARLFIGSCVGVVVLATLAVIPTLMPSPDVVRYPAFDPVGEVHLGDVIEPVRTVRKARRTRSPSKTRTPPQPVISEAPAPQKAAPQPVTALPPVQLSSLQPGAAL